MGMVATLPPLEESMRSYPIAAILTMCACTSTPDAMTSTQSVSGPTGVTVTAQVAGQLVVSWSPDATAFKYYVYQSSAGAPFTFLTSVIDPSAQPPAPTTYTATGLTGGVQYCYEVQSAYPDGSTSDIGSAGCGIALGAGTPSPGTTHRRNVPLAIVWSNPTNLWVPSTVGLRSVSTGGLNQGEGATAIDVPFEVGDTVIGAEIWRFSDGTLGAKGASPVLAAGNDFIIAAGEDSIPSNATTRSMYSIPQINGVSPHVMAAGERLRLVLFARPSPGYTIDSVNLLYTAAQ